MTPSKTQPCSSERTSSRRLTSKPYTVRLIRTLLVLCGGLGLAHLVMPSRVKVAHAEEAMHSAKPEECVKYRGEARYGAYGYNHVVILRAQCTDKVSCTVTTSVNPEPQFVELEAKGQTEVFTFMGSPAREFTANVICQKKKGS